MKKSKSIDHARFMIRECLSQSLMNGADEAKLKKDATDVNKGLKFNLPQGDLDAIIKEVWELRNSPVLKFLKGLLPSVYKKKKRTKSLQLDIFKSP